MAAEVHRIADIFAGRAPAGSRVTVQGWIRTRRDSKAGLSFLPVHDGSCFDPLQVVAPAALANHYGDDASLTENTRGAYPISHVPSVVADGRGGRPPTWHRQGGGPRRGRATKRPENAVQTALARELNKPPA